MIIAGIFFLIGALFTGKILKKKVKNWQAILSSALLFIGWLLYLHIAYQGNVPNVATSQVMFSTVMLFFGLKSSIFLDTSEKEEYNV